MKITPKSGVGLHRVLLKSVIRAPQSFFDETDSGITLNRFSQDMTLIDGSLPNAAVMSLWSELLFPIPYNGEADNFSWNAMSRSIRLDCSRINLYGHHLSCHDHCPISPSKILPAYISTDAILRFRVQESIIHAFCRDFGGPVHDQGLWMATALRQYQSQES